MNHQTFKTARISSCSTKKSSTKPNKSQSKTKKNLQSTFTKMSIPNPLLANSSVLTQRINTHNKCKALFSNPESENNLRVKSSHKKLSKVISQLKTDRKAEYTKLKAQQIESQLEKKPVKIKRSVRRSSVQTKPQINQAKSAKNECENSNFGIDLSKVSRMVKPETENFTKNMFSSDQNALSEISRNQKQLIEKITSLERQNNTLSQKSEQVINEIKYKYDEEVLSLKEQLKILNCRFNQQNNKNTMIEKKSQTYDKEYATLKEKLHQKDQRISYLDKHNKSMQQELKNAKDSIRNYEIKVQNLQTNIQDLRNVKTQIEEKLKKCQKEKQYIKQNCTQVLSILRQEFGQELKLLSF